MIFNISFEQNSYSKIKPKLVVLLDNSQSISFLNKDNELKEILNAVKGNDILNNKYDIEYFTFDDDIKPLDSMTFSATQTNISRSINSVNSLFKNEISQQQNEQSKLLIQQICWQVVNKIHSSQTA